MRLTTLILVITLSISPSLASAKDAGKFSRGNIVSLCGVIKTDQIKLIHEKMDNLIKEGGVTKESFNKHYVFTIACTKRVPLHYAANKGYEQFLKFAEYGVDLEHSFKDLDDHITTLKDHAKYKAQTTKGNERLEWRKIFFYLKKNKVKGCQEQPQLNCSPKYYKPAS